MVWKGKENENKVKEMIWEIKNTNNSVSTCLSTWSH